jgi:hypothetical protein
MLGFLQPSESARKTRLFKCAFCRLFWHLLKDQRSRAGVEIAERIADEEANHEEWSRAVTDAEATSTRGYISRGISHGDLTEGARSRADVAGCWPLAGVG